MKRWVYSEARVFRAYLSTWTLQTFTVQSLRYWEANEVKVTEMNSSGKT